ncbi:WD40/YVTN/BNR-like repeat-containing protein [Cupriavidus basilensis]|uniref:WD40/YVTN/BNR-like repeat-containing protein n=1 Tax=Cupriavidus basilensis TaxID=68895 RepID=UPI00284742FB|nr:exo-alpha-sialidase [Cupriavidus basilensis]MDR3382274.1 exo-alpha-sialidase [Cupriavidus basilensis]
MNDQLLIGTRKGLLMLRRDSALGWLQESVHFLGEPVSMVLGDPRDGALYAALNLGHFGVKLWRRRARGVDWEACAVPVYPPQPEPDPPGEVAVPGVPIPAQTGEPAVAPPPVPWSLQQIWSMETGGADESGVLWAGTLPGGLFRSGDGGASWALNRPLWDRPERSEWFGGGYDVPGIHSICVDPHDSRHVTVAVSCGGVWQTRDGGRNWACTASGMVADYMPPERREDGNIQDPHRLAQCAGHPHAMWVQHHGGIFRSGDAGMHWQRLHAKPSSFGFAVAAHPRRPNTAWFVPAVKDECRVPVDGKLVVTRTRDGGVSFEAFSEGLPAAPSYDLIYRHGLAVDHTGERLAMGSTTGSLWISESGGERWKLFSAHLPPVYCVRFV